MEFITVICTWIVRIRELIHLNPQKFSGIVTFLRQVRIPGTNGALQENSLDFKSEGPTMRHVAVHKDSLLASSYPYNSQEN